MSGLCTASESSITSVDPVRPVVEVADCPRTITLRAADGPAVTLVVDMRAPGRRRAHQDAVAELAECRLIAMARDPRLGAKTIGVVGCAGSELELIFVQGEGDRLDALSEVCLNSSVCAVDVARDIWCLLPEGPVTVRIGAVTFTVTEVSEVAG